MSVARDVDTQTIVKEVGGAMRNAKVIGRPAGRACDVSPNGGFMDKTPIMDIPRWNGRSRARA